MCFFNKTRWNQIFINQIHQGAINSRFYSASAGRCFGNQFLCIGASLFSIATKFNPGSSAGVGWAEQSMAFCFIRQLFPLLLYRTKGRNGRYGHHRSGQTQRKDDIAEAAGRKTGKNKTINIPSSSEGTEGCLGIHRVGQRSPVL